MSAPPFLRIGPVDASVDAGAVKKYREATALDGRETACDEVPATFPAIWLWHPAAREALADLAGGAFGIPVLMAQRFSYRRPLRIGEAVRFVITRLAEPGAPRDVRIEAHIEAPDGEVIADFSATYRLFGQDGEAA